jgi:hypothetical protein
MMVMNLLEIFIKKWKSEHLLVGGFNPSEKK